MLNPKTSRLDGCGGGIPTLTVTDISQACSGADKIGVELLMRMWAGTESKIDFSEVMKEIEEVGRFWKIQGNRREKLESLLELVLFEKTKVPTCSYCWGRGERMTQGKLTECNPCRGTGKYRIKDTEKAAMLGIKSASWGVWEPRMTEVRIILDNHTHRALRSISRKLED